MNLAVMLSEAEAPFNTPFDYAKSDTIEKL